MALISVRKSDVPVYLHKSDFYLALNDDDEDEEVHIPQNCFKPNTDVQNADDLTLLLSTLRFWGVSAIPQSVVTYTVWHKPVEVIDAFVEFEQQLRYVKFLRALCEKIDQCSGQMRDRATAWNRVIMELYYLPCVEIKTALLCAYQYEYEDNGMAWTVKTCQLAAAAEEPGILRFLHEHGCPWDETCCETAGKSYYTGCLKYAQEHGCPWDSRTCSAAAAQTYGLPCLQYAHKHGCPWDSTAYENARYGGRCYMYLVENGCPEGEGAIIAAARAGDLERVKTLHEKGCAWSERASNAAAYNGHLPVLKFLHDRGCPFGDEIGGLAVAGECMDCLQYLWESNLVRGDRALNIASKNRGNLALFRYLLDAGCDTKSVFIYAAVFDNPDAMRYALEKGCPLSATVLEIAAVSSSLECIRIARDHGCNWSPLTSAFIVRAFEDLLEVDERSRGDVSTATLACLRYAHEHGCPWDEGTCQYAAISDELACLQYAHEHGCPWHVAAVKDAATAGSLSCLQYLHEHGCEWPEPAWFQQVAKTVRNRKCLEYAAEHPDQRTPVQVTLPADCTGWGCAESNQQAQPQGDPVQTGLALPDRAAEEGDGWQVVGKRGRAVRDRSQSPPASSSNRAYTSDLCRSPERAGGAEGVFHVSAAPAGYDTVPAPYSVAAHAADTEAGAMQLVENKPSADAGEGEQPDWTLVTSRKRRRNTVSY